MIRKPLIFAAIAAAAIPAGAHAQRGNAEWRQTSVRIADLDLSTRAGTDELDRRIDRAVDRICEGDRECRDGAWASTWDQVDAAIARDQWMRRLAAEREAELAACGWQGCRQAPMPVYYPAPPPAYGGATVIVITTGYAPPPQVQVHSWPR